MDVRIDQLFDRGARDTGQAAGEFAPGAEVQLFLAVGADGRSRRTPVGDRDGCHRRGVLAGTSAEPALTAPHPGPPPTPPPVPPTLRPPARTPTRLTPTPPSPPRTPPP